MALFLAILISLVALMTFFVFGAVYLKRRHNEIFIVSAALAVIAAGVFLFLFFESSQETFTHPYQGVKPTPTSAISRSGPTPTPVPIVNLNPSKIEIITDTPTSMQINQSYEVKVSLIPKGQAIVSTLSIEKASATPSEALPAGTPGSTLQNAFGYGYEVSAIAILSPNDGPFKIDLIGPQEQPLNPPSVTWKWIVIPVVQGSQLMDVDIEAIWKFAHIFSHKARIGDKQFIVHVKGPPPTPTPIPTPTPTPHPEPFISPGQIKVGDLLTSLLVALLGAGGLGALFIVWLVQRSKRKNHPDPKPSKSRSNKKRGRH